MNYTSLFDIINPNPECKTTTHSLMMYKVSIMSILYSCISNIDKTIELYSLDNLMKYFLFVACITRSSLVTAFLYDE